MSFNLKNRNFLTLMDFTPKEIQYLLDLSLELKKAKYAGTEQQKLKREKHCFNILKKIALAPVAPLKLQL